MRHHLRVNLGQQPSSVFMIRPHAQSAYPPDVTPGGSPAHPADGVRVAARCGVITTRAFNRRACIASHAVIGAMNGTHH
jgi:hypothetical protein